MFPQNLLALATRRQVESGIRRLASWCSLGDGRWAIAVTTVEGPDGTPTFERHRTGVPSPIIAAGLAANQDRVDKDLRSSVGAAREDALRECMLLSLACDAGEELLFSCRAAPQDARQLVKAFEKALFRVRAGLVAPSVEFPRLAAVVQNICGRPVSLAA